MAISDQGVPAAFQVLSWLIRWPVSWWVSGKERMRTGESLSPGPSPRERGDVGGVEGDSSGAAAGAGEVEGVGLEAPGLRCAASGVTDGVSATRKLGEAGGTGAAISSSRERGDVAGGADPGLRCAASGVTDGVSATWKLGEAGGTGVPFVPCSFNPLLRTCVLAKKSGLLATKAFSTESFGSLFPMRSSFFAMRVEATSRISWRLR